MEAIDAAIAVLREADGPLHWTVIQDRALRKGLLDPFTQPRIREAMIAALARAAREGRLTKVGTGTYALPGPGSVAG